MKRDSRINRALPGEIIRSRFSSRTIMIAMEQAAADGVQLEFFGLSISVRKGIEKIIERAIAAGILSEPNSFNYVTLLQRAKEADRGTIIQAERNDRLREMDSRLNETTPPAPPQRNSQPSPPRARELSPNSPVDCAVKRNRIMNEVEDERLNLSNEEYSAEVERRFQEWIMEHDVPISTTANEL